MIRPPPGVVQDQQVRPRAGRDCVGATLLVAELRAKSWRQAARRSCRPDRAQAAAREGLSAMPPRPRETAFRLCVPFRFHHSTQHVRTSARSRRVARSRRSLTQHSFRSPNGRIEAPMGSPSVHGNLGGLAGARGLKQSISQPRGVAALKVEGFAKYPSLVTTVRVRRDQAIVLLRISRIASWLCGRRVVMGSTRYLFRSRWPRPADSQKSGLCARAGHPITCRHGGPPKGLVEQSRTTGKMSGSIPAYG